MHGSHRSHRCEAEDTSKAVETYELACQSEEAYDGDETTLALLLTKRGQTILCWSRSDVFSPKRSQNEVRGCLGMSCETTRGLALAELDDLEDALKDHEQARSVAEEGPWAVRKMTCR